MNQAWCCCNCLFLAACAAANTVTLRSGATLHFLAACAAANDSKITAGALLLFLAACAAANLM